MIFGDGVEIQLDPPTGPSFVQAPPTPPTTTIAPPSGPTFVMGEPEPPDVIVVPIVGPAGPAGNGTGGGAAFVYHQSSPAATWIVSHTLGAYPQVELLDDNFTVVDSDIIHSSDSVVTVIYAAPRTGYVVMK